jgi:predicted permease
MRTLLQDVRYGYRMLIKNPGFTSVAVITLALAIGANTAIFSVINALVLKTLPVRDSESLVILGDTSSVHSRSAGTPTLDVFSYPLYKSFAEQNDVFSSMAATGDIRRLHVTTGTEGSGQEEPGRGRLVTGNYFSMLNVRPALGRLFGEPESDPGHPVPVVVLSYTYWTRKFAADPHIVGQTIHVNRAPVTVIGVTQPGFEGEVSGELQDVFIPMSMQTAMQPGKSWLESPNVSWLNIMGRLKPGVSLVQAKARLNVLYQQALTGPYGATLSFDDRESIKKLQLNVVSGAHGYSWARDQFSRPMMMLLGIVAMVLLIACTNVSNMLLARSSARQTEIALRLALGASPSRIVRQLLTESVLLSMLGGVLGLLVANWGTHLLLRWAGQQFTNLQLDTAPDLRVMLFTATICLVTGVLFGLVPAIRAMHMELNASMQSARMSSGFGKGRLVSAGNFLVAGQIAISLLVIFAAGLLVRSLHNLQELDLGYARDKLLMVRLDPLAAGYDQAKVTNASRLLVDAISAVPGVTSVTSSENGLFSGTESGETIVIDGMTFQKESDSDVAFDQVGPNYFSSIGIPVLLGREIGPQDTETSPHVAVINESMAKFYFKDTNPIGRKIRLRAREYKDKPSYEIVGVARDVKDHDIRGPVDRRFYVSLHQPISPGAALNLEIRTAVDPAGLMDSIRARIHSVDPALPIANIRTLREQADRVVFRETLLAKLAGLFGGLALVLAAVGIYGLMSYLVISRTKEIGIRMALGAKRSQILGSVLRHSFVLAGLGVVLGVPLAFMGARALRSILFEVGAIDPLTLGCAVCLLSSVALAAALVPARSATRVDPMVALRHE